MSKAFRSIAAASLLTPFVALAQTTAPAPAAPAAEAKPPPWYSLITVGGAVDAYYQLRGDAAQDAALGGRAFDGATGFNVGYAKLTAALEPKPAGFRLDLGFGPTADVLTPGAAAKYVQQAYVSVKLPYDIVVDGGRFVTSAGSEVIEAKDNWIYSRSILFTLIPYTHVGVRATVPIADTGVTAVLGVNNGWDVLGGNNPAKTFQVSLSWAGPMSSTLAANLYTGVNPTDWAGQPNTKEWRTLIDVIAAAAFGPLALNLNFDWGTEAGSSYWGLAAMAKYTLPGDPLHVSLRGEYVQDLKGVRFATGKDTNVWEGTLSVGVPVGGNAEVRLEGRYDKASEKVFTVAKDSQFTVALAALAWF